MLRRLFSFNEAKFQALNNIAQGATEYLLIVGAVVAISLIVVGLTLSSTPSTTQLSNQSNNLQGALNELELIDFTVDAGGNAALVLKNNAGEKLTVTRVIVDGNNKHVFGSGVRMYAGSKKVFVLNHLSSCSLAKKKNYSLIVSYTSAYNIDKNASFGTRSVDCISAVNPVGTYSPESTPNLNEPDINWPAGGLSGIVQLDAGTTEYALGITTDVSAACHYSNTSDINYFLMPGVFTDLTTSHLATITGLVSGSNIVYVRCKNNETKIVNSSDFEVEMIVGSAAQNQNYAYFYLDTDFNQQSAIFNYSKLVGSNSGVMVDVNTVLWNYLDVNLVGLWHLDEASGTLVDSTGNGHNTTTGGTVTYAQSGKYTNAVSFGGGYASGTKLGLAAPFTYAAWVYETDICNNYQQYLADGSNNTDGVNLYCQTNHKHAMAINDGGWGACYAEGTTNYKQNNWQYVVGVYTGTQIKIYVDGVLEKTSGCPGNAIGYNTNPLYFGKKGVGNNFTGKLDDVAIWNRALTDAEIKLIYDKNAPLQNSGVDHYSDINYISAVFDTTSATTNFNSIYFNNSGLIYGVQINPALETDLNNGLVGLWHLNETAGTTFADSSGQMHNGSCSGGTCPSPAVGLWDTNAQRFNGSINYITLGNNLNFDSSFTVSTWVNLKQLNSISSIIGKSGYSSDFDLQYENNAFRFYLSTSNGNYNVASVVFPQANQWYDLAVTWDKPNSSLSMYVNGNLQNSVTAGGNRVTNSGDFCIGQSCYWGGRYLTGFVDEVAIWNRALSASEVQNLFSKGSTKLGVEYRSCNDANCIGESWSDLNYSAKLDVNISSVSQNEYFQYLVKPTYLDFPYLISESCSSNPNSDCSQWSSYEECSSYNYHNWQCGWYGENCVGDVGTACSDITNPDDCSGLDGGLGMCYWSGDYCEGDAWEACTSAATEEVCNAVGVNFAGKSKESLAQKALFMGFKGNALENKVPRLNFSTTDTVCYWDWEYGCQVNYGCYGVYDSDICNNNVSGCYWNYGTCYQDLGCSVFNDYGSEACNNYNYLGCYWDSSTYCYGSVTCAGQNSQSDISGACNSIPGCQYNSSYGHSKMLSAYPVFKDFNLRYSN